MVEPRGSMAKLAERAQAALRPTLCPALLPALLPTLCPTLLPAPFQPLGPHLAPQPLEQRRRHHNLVRDQSHQLLRSVPLLRENPQDRRSTRSAVRFSPGSSTEPTECTRAPASPTSGRRSCGRVWNSAFSGSSVRTATRRTRSASCGKLNGTVAMARLRVAPPLRPQHIGPTEPVAWRRAWGPLRTGNWLGQAKN